MRHASPNTRSLGFCGAWAAVGCLWLGGCGSKHDAPHDLEVSSRAAALSAAACSATHAVSLQDTKSRCDDVRSSTGLWIGSEILRLSNGVYCSHRWQSHQKGDGATATNATAPAAARSLTPTSTRTPTVVVPSRSVVAAPPKSLAATPVTGGRPVTVRLPAAKSDQQQDAKPGSKDERPDAEPAPNDYPPDLEVLMSKHPRVEPDCPVVGLTAPVVGPDDPRWLEAQRDTYRRQAGWVQQLPPSETHIGVAVVDSAARPFHSALPDTYGHGRGVGRVIADLACPQDSTSRCSVQVANNLALPLRKPHWSDYVSGGYYGTRGQLASAMAQAVSTWRRDYDKTGAARLVLNLSLAWDQKHGGAFKGDYRELNLTSQVVYATLKYASCMGALVVAAVGNASSAADIGPMYPAAWEAIPAPGAKECAEEGWTRAPGGLRVHPTTAKATSPGDYHPLVYAVGAVDALDTPLASARPKSQPQRVAYGLAVVTDDPLRGGWTDGLTGSSMAAAIVSGVAAAAWSYLPHLTAYELMELLDKTSIPLDARRLETELCLETPSPCATYPVKRVSACATLQHALAEAGGPELDCKTIPAHEGKAVAAGQPDTTAYEKLDTPTGTCATPDCGVTGGTIAKSQAPWVGPQPGYPTCTSCFLLRNWEYLFVDFGADMSMQPQFVTFGGVTPHTSLNYDVPSSSLGYPRRFAVHLPGTTQVLQAQITTVYSVGYMTISIEEPIGVY